MCCKNAEINYLDQNRIWFFLGLHRIIHHICDVKMYCINLAFLLQTVAQVVDFESGVFCVDHDKSSHHYPKIVVGSSTSLHLFKQEKR